MPAAEFNQVAARCWLRLARELRNTGQRPFDVGFSARDDVTGFEIKLSYRAGAKVTDQRVVVVDALA